MQPSWAFLTVEGQWDDQANLSGSIAHGKESFGKIGYFGPVPADCELLDGVFIGVRKAALKQAGVEFDPIFNFHFYDVDFCIKVRRHGLSLGTWPIALTHQSPGGYGQDWLTGYKIFCQKWDNAVLENQQPDHRKSEVVMQIMEPPAMHTLVNHELIAMIPESARCIIDVGCRYGQMADVYKKMHPGVRYVGIDIDPDYAVMAARHCDEIFAADIESLSDTQFQRLFPSDCWLFGECLEHLKDPWTILRKIRSAIDPDGCVLVCMLNAQHWGVQLRLLSGQFQYEDGGLLDRTNLRWFTRSTMLELFHQTGWSVVQGLTRTLPVAPKQAQALTGIRAFAQACGVDPELAVDDAQPFQYMFKLVPAASIGS